MTYPDGYTWDPISGLYYTYTSSSVAGENSYIDTVIGYSFYDASYDYYYYTNIEANYYEANYCSNIPSGYTYDSNSGLYYEQSSSTTYSSISGEYTTTTTTSYYDCSTNYSFQTTDIVVSTSA